MTASPPNSRHLDLVESNKLLRQTLKKHFPGVKFSIKGSRFAGGTATDVRWVDGPTERSVTEVTKGFVNRDFDGSVDMSVYLLSWLLPDGTLLPAINPGTLGQRGSISPSSTPCPPGAELVQTGIGFLHCRRETTNQFRDKVAAAFAALNFAEQQKLLDKAPFPHSTDRVYRISHIIPG